jgi:hypothetical protein
MEYRLRDFFHSHPARRRISTEKMSESDNRRGKMTKKAPDSFKCGVLHSDPAVVGRKSGHWEMPGEDFCTIGE